MLSNLKISRSNLKIYIIIFIATALVIALGINSYISAKSKMLELSNANKITISQNLLNTFQNWFDERFSSLGRASKFIETANMLSEDAKISEFLRIFAQNSPEFDRVQLLTRQGDIWVDGARPSLDNIDVPLLGLIWYLRTRDELAPTLHFMPKHYVLNQGTLNFCVPNFYNGEFRAVLCGVVKLSSMFDKIQDFKLPPNFYSFLITNGGKILTPMSDETLKSKIQENLKQRFISRDLPQNIELDSNFISLLEIKHLNWFVGVGADTHQETSALLSQIGKNAAMVLLGFLGLAFLANFLHNITYAHLDTQKRAYEALLTHKARMGELGELVSGINHQFIQPVNSLRLIISSLINLRKNDTLDDKTLDLMLNRADASIVLLGDTIEIFRNFYKTSQTASDFSVKTSIKNLLTLMHTELSRANVSVKMGEFDDTHVRQIENVIQQILLILLHNAKDALIERYTDAFSSRVIDINVKFDDIHCYIDVCDTGHGVSKSLQEKIFELPKTTKKSGNGIGLYFGKRLANDKLGGDIKLVSVASPTIFQLSFLRNIKDTDCVKNEL